MTEKLASYSGVWNKYLPVIKILLKKSATGEQILGMNRSDFDKAAGFRKSGYKFVINLINNQSDILYSGNDFAQSFISVLQDDDTIRKLLLMNNYSFLFTSKYQLHIKNNGVLAQAAEPAFEEEILIH